MRHTIIYSPGTPDGRPDSSVEQMQDVFHELHAEGRQQLFARSASASTGNPGDDDGDLSRRAQNSFESG